MRVNLIKNGLPVSTRGTRSPGNIVLAFDTSGSTVFPSTYQTFLQNVFNTTQSTLNSLFGMPIQGGTVYVRNYDSTIGDRDAVAGGYYLPDNGSGQREIDFPVYQANETTAVNFVHTLLLAYQGTTPYAYDAFEEGLARAVTATVMRENLISGLDAGTVEDVLRSTYDVEGDYDYCNQRALGGPVFIAPNLRSLAIPNGVSNGGLYLLRYRMSGTAWLKVLTEYPTFVAALNAQLAATPTLASNVPGLVAAGQSILNSLRPSNPTIEGMSFAQWFERQWILDTTLTAGPKLLVQPVPQPATVTSDFGVFDLEINYFTTDSSGNESLQSGTCYPIFLDPAYNRFATSAQDEQATITLGYGSVTPNYAASYESGQQYRVTVDMPVLDQVARLYLPAGSFSTGSNTAVNDFYGTVVGADTSSGTTEDVKVFAGGVQVGDAPVVNGAFGISINQPAYDIARTIEVQLYQTVNGTATMILDRFIDKAATGTLADSAEIGQYVDLRVGGEGNYQIVSLPAGLNAIGFPIDPFISNFASVLGADPAQLLVARYNGSTGQYILNPDTEPFKIGNGYFVQNPAVTNVTIPGRLAVGIPKAVALRPGWNLIADPLLESVPTSNISVIHAADETLYPFASELGGFLGSQFFSFQQGASDPSTGYPDTGTFISATQFSPGQAYFVRCYEPEGVTLLFSPATEALKNSSVKPQIVSNPIRWSINVIASDDAGNFCKCIAGMSYSATDGFDLKLDSEAPPAIAGLTITSEGATPLYQDIRSVKPTQTWSLDVKNMTVGKIYTLQFQFGVGLVPRLAVKNLSTGVTTNVQTGGRLRFVAKSSAQTFTLTVKGVQ
jgi:hypothetical protein